MLFRFSLARLEALELAKCETEALRQYVSDNRALHGGEELLAAGIIAIETTKRRLPGGNIFITVSVMHRKEQYSDTWTFFLQTKGRRVERVEGKHFTRR